MKKVALLTKYNEIGCLGYMTCLIGYVMIFVALLRNQSVEVIKKCVKRMTMLIIRSPEWVYSNTGLTMR